MNSPASIPSAAIPTCQIRCARRSGLGNALRVPSYPLNPRATCDRADCTGRQNHAAALKPARIVGPPESHKAGLLSGTLGRPAGNRDRYALEIRSLPPNTEHKRRTGSNPVPSRDFSPGTICLTSENDSSAAHESQRRKNGDLLNRHQHRPATRSKIGNT